MDMVFEEAIKKGQINTVLRLLDAGASIDSKDRYGQTGLMLAAHFGYHDIAKALVERGAALNHTAKFGLSALMLAIIAGHADIARLLIKAGANTTLKGTGAPGFAGKTARNLAVDRGMSEITALLLPGTDT